MPIKWKSFNGNGNERGRGPGGWVPFFPGIPSQTQKKNEGPAIDVYQDKNNLYIEMPLYGIKPESVEVSVDDNILSVQSKVNEKQIKQKTDYLHQEIIKGSFRRSIKLPVKVKSNEAVAEFSNSILKISIPKVAEVASKAKKIPIKIK